MKTRIQTTTFRVRYLFDRPVSGTAEEVRGFFGCLFPEETLLHQHLPSKQQQTLYRYPLVLYRPPSQQEISLLGIDAGAATLAAVYDQFESITLGSREYRVRERQGVLRSEPFGLAPAPVSYRFLTPWLPLSQKNYARFAALRTRTEQQALLERILVGNLLSASKSLGYTVPGRIVVVLDDDWTTEVRQAKNVPVIGVRGGFSANFQIPEGMGIGRAVSRGNGVCRPSPKP